MKTKKLLLTLVLSLVLASTPAKADLDVASFARGVLFVGSAYMLAKTIKKEDKKITDKAIIAASVAVITGTLLTKDTKAYLLFKTLDLIGDTIDITQNIYEKITGRQ